ncbi:MAG: hypothetical protein R6V57_16360 [Vicinamibacterales bacterium]
MRRLFLVLLLMGCLAPADAGAQTRTATRKPAAKVAPAEVDCPSPLGSGVGTGRVFCDVPIGRTPADGITVTIPPHRGATVLTFDLHNRMTYSEDLVRAGRSYARLTATIGVMTMDNTLITRAVVQNEFRTAADLFDRIGGGAGPSGLKAVAPTGAESIRVELPADLTQVCVLGEKLAARRPDADELFTGPGRPIALISNVMVEFVPAPAVKPPVKRAPVKKAPAKK